MCSWWYSRQANDTADSKRSSFSKNTVIKVFLLCTEPTSHLYFGNNMHLVEENYKQIHIHTHRNYCNLCYACMLRDNKYVFLLLPSANQLHVVKWEQYIYLGI